MPKMLATLIIHSGSARVPCTLKPHPLYGSSLGPSLTYSIQMYIQSGALRTNDDILHQQKRCDLTVNALV